MQYVDSQMKQVRFRPNLGPILGYVHLLKWQNFPVHPGGHWQVNELIPSWQVPLLTHGWFWQSLISREKSKKENIFAGPNLECARMPEALCFTVGHALFADCVPGWHSLITAG